MSDSATCPKGQTNERTDRFASCSDRKREKTKAKTTAKSKWRWSLEYSGHFEYGEAELTSLIIIIGYSCLAHACFSFFILDHYHYSRLLRTENSSGDRVV